MGHLKRNRQNRTGRTGHPRSSFLKHLINLLNSTFQKHGKPLINFEKFSEKSNTVFIKWNRRARPGQPEQDRKTATRIGQPLQKRWNKTFRTGLHGQDYQDGTARTGLPGQNCQDRTAWTGLPEHGYQETASTGLLG
jgi:hypothetical protein